MAVREQRDSLGECQSRPWRSPELMDGSEVVETVWFGYDGLGWLSIADGGQRRERARRRVSGGRWKTMARSEDQGVSGAAHKEANCSSTVS